MAVQFEDYYQVLGVSRDASQDEIRKAFRKLARKYHPDVTEDKEAGEEKFKQINEAYEVLGNAENRQKYDQLGANWKQGQDFSGFGGGHPFGGGDRGGGAGGGNSFHFGGSTGFSDFFESLFGQRAAGGGDPFGAYTRAQQTPRASKGADIEADLMVTLDEVMNGSTRQLQLDRSDESGSAKRSTVRVTIPRGVSEAQHIRLAGLGQPGFNGGPPGDLYLKTRIARHPDFILRGHAGDLNHDLNITPWDAALGAEITVPTPHGKVKLKIPAGTQPGTEMRLRGKGMAKDADTCGDLYVAVTVTIPTDLSDADRELWQALADASDSEFPSGS